MKTLIGEFTFVESSQNDYEELYRQHNVQEKDLNKNKPHFCIVHRVYNSVDYSEEMIDSLENHGQDYLTPEQYSGIIIYKNQTN